MREYIYIYTQIECNKAKQNKKSASCVQKHTHIHTKEEKCYGFHFCVGQLCRSTGQRPALENVSFNDTPLEIKPTTEVSFT